MPTVAHAIEAHHALRIVNHMIFGINRRAAAIFLAQTAADTCSLVEMRLENRKLRQAAQ